MDKESNEIIEVAEGPSVSVDDPPNREHRVSAVREGAGYGIKVRVEIPYEQALLSTRESLKQQGFDIVNEIDMRKMFAEAISKKFPRYSIISVCIPDLAFRALERDKDLGLLMPCNVVVYEHGDCSIISAIDPIVLFSIADGHGLRDLSLDVKQRLQTAVNHVAVGVV